MNQRMMMTMFVSLSLLVCSLNAQTTPAVAESARDIPIVQNVDVVVVGGSTGAVSAALSAARSGARVFLAAPRTYLGEDMCAWQHLWLEEGETPQSPLARSIYVRRTLPARVARKGLSFSYTADKPCAEKHKDSNPPSKLSNGQWGSSSSQSVQFDQNVVITADLGSVQTVSVAHLIAYHRAGDFQVESMLVSTSADGKEWSRPAEVAAQPDGVANDAPMELSGAINKAVRYVKLDIRKVADSKRILLGQIILEGEALPVATAEKAAPEPIIVTPMHVKRTLNNAMLEANVPYLFSCYATDVLRDAEGNVCGIVMANRAGRQAVVAKVVIDATDRAWVARMAGAQFAPWPGGSLTFQRTVIGGELKTGRNFTGVKMPFMQISEGRPADAAKKADAGKKADTGKKVETAKSASSHVVMHKSYPIYVYTFTLPLTDGGYAALASADQAARDATFDVNQVDDSESLFMVPPDPVRGKTLCTGPWAGADKLDVDAFRPAGVSRLLVLGGCASVSREQAGKLLRPLALMEMGERIGLAAAQEALALPAVKNPSLPGGACKAAAAGEVRESLAGLRPMNEKLPTLRQEQRGLPVIGQYDVVVVGGGTSGAPAAIGAARQGSRTLLVEYLNGLGGVSTLGLIGKYYFGMREGFTSQIDEGVRALTPTMSVVAKMEWYRREIRKAGGDIWFGTIGCGAMVSNGKVLGVVVATPQGRGVVLCKTVIDATGNSDVAAAAGATCVYHEDTEIAVQGTGLSPRTPGVSYENTDYTFIDDSDMVDVWNVFTFATEKFKNFYDLSPVINSRERRRIVGDHVMSPLDEINNRTYEDTVVYCYSNFDSHGYTVHPAFFLMEPPHKGVYTNVPYRALLPKGLDGILVVGLGVSAQRDAVPVIRMQPDLQNEGYAAGVAASMASKAGTSTRAVDIKKLQAHLVEIGSLPKSVLTDKDSYPLPTEKVEEAVKSLKDNYKGVTLVLACPEQSLPLLRKAFAESASAQDQLVYAHVLGMMGDDVGALALATAVRDADWDKGWNFKGMGQFGWTVSRLDSLLIALGKTRNRQALPILIQKAKTLDATSEFSHMRAVALAMEAIGDPAAADVLAELLGKPGMMGHWATSQTQARSADAPQARTGVAIENTKTRYEDRTGALREIVLARALYRCGDRNGLGRKILTEYASDVRAHFAAHARAVLAGEKK